MSSSTAMTSSNRRHSSSQSPSSTEQESSTGRLTTKKIISPRRPSMSGPSSTPTIQVATLNIQPIPLRINTNVSSSSSTTTSMSHHHQQPHLSFTNSSPNSPTNDDGNSSQQQIPLRTNARKPKKVTKNPFTLNKLQLPTKKNEYEITTSGTWKYADFQIAPYGMKPSSNTPSSSTSTNAAWTPSPITPEQYFNKQQPQLSTSGGSSGGNSGSNSGSSSSIASQKLQLEQLERKFASINYDFNSPPQQQQQQQQQHDFPPPSAVINSTITYDQLHLDKKSKLGAGASATVHRVTHRLDNKVYALKIVPLYEKDVQPKQIISEIRSLYESMECPYIVRFYEAFHREGSIRILLEYMDCGSLEDVYKTVGKMPENALSVITFQILHGLHYLEQKKILHRDIKPSNILLNRDGSAKISDFGMSKQLTTSIQAFKTFIGTYVYMSPERLKGDNHSYESDIWSLGVSIAECAIGQFPFDIKQLGVFDVLNHITEHGLDIKEDQLSRELIDFLKKTTVVDPTQRPSAAALLQHPWILKYQQQKMSKDNREVAARWLNDVYRPERKRKHQLKHQEKKRRDSIGNKTDKKSPRDNKKY
jgi:hypothetical protein